MAFTVASRRMVDVASRKLRCSAVDSRAVTGCFRRRLFTAVLARVRWSKTETKKGRRWRYLKNGIANHAKGISSRL